MNTPNDERLKKPSTPAKPDLLTETMRDAQSRGMEDRSVTEKRELSDDERLEMVRTGFMQIKLPDLPALPGYHTCWLSSTSTTDTIAWRLQVGYELLKPEEVPGWQHGNCAEERFTGYVGVNEMVGAKIKESLYKRLMKMLHHDEPNAMEVGIKSQLDQYKGDAEEAGSKLEMSEDMEALGRNKPAPVSW